MQRFKKSLVIPASDLLPASVVNRAEQARQGNKSRKPANTRPPAEKGRYNRFAAIKYYGQLMMLHFPTISYTVQAKRLKWLGKRATKDWTSEQWEKLYGIMDVIISQWEAVRKKQKIAAKWPQLYWFDPLSGWASTFEGWYDDHKGDAEAAVRGQAGIDRLLAADKKRRRARVED